MTTTGPAPRVALAARALAAPRVALAACALAALCACDDLGAVDGPTLAPVTITVWSPPRPVPTPEGIVLAYELSLSDYAAEELTLASVTILAGSATGPAVQTIAGDDLEASLVAAVPEKGLPAMVYLWPTFATRAQVPATLHHRLAFTTADGAAQEVTGGAVDVASGPTVVVAPPVAGAGWLAANGPANDQPHHRRSAIAFSGHPKIGQRFGVDWMQLGPDGRLYREDGSRNGDYYCHGRELLAVADATVVDVRDGVPEQQPGEPMPAPLTLENVAGNFVILDLGGGVFAAYAHVVPGTIRVQVGEAVTVGTVLGLLGNSGNSSAPHLHFQLMDASSFLNAEGVPYVLDSVSYVGTIPLEYLVAAEPWLPTDPPVTRTELLFGDNDVLDFPPARHSAAQVAAVTAVVDEVMRAQDVPGVMVAVWEADKEPLLVVRGHADEPAARALDARDAFRIASVTKTFTATIVLQLVDEGVLRLEDTIDQWFPEVPHAAEITLELLLSMRAGVWDFFYQDPTVASEYVTHPLRQWTAAELYQILTAHAEPQFEPGAACVYSNANYFLLGQLVERVTGSSLGAEIASRILAPLGMTHTSFPTTAAMPDPHSHGYRAAASGGLEDVTSVHPSLPGAGGAMISTLDDLRTWVRALYRGDLLSEQTQARRLQFHPMSGSTCMRYGLGVMDACGFVGHNGAILGFNNFTTYLPERDAVVIVVVNRCDETAAAPPATALWQGVTRALYPDLVSW
jgi:D-alanyl-D-alanine carboxypeptidase